MRQEMGLEHGRRGPAPEGAQHCWAVILAGGEGMRLRPLIRQVLGADRPKQYVRLLGARTLLRQTLDRVALAIPDERTLVVTVRQHAGYITEEFAGTAHPRVLAQPLDRGTAAGVLYPAHWIAWRNPEATIAVFPSDHFLLGETSFMAHVAEVTVWVEKHPERLVLLGAQPTSPEVEYGWIEPDEPLGRLSTGAVRAVRQFWEKPSVARARAALAAGHLWNTSVLVGKVATLVQTGWQALPELSDRLAHIEPFAGTAEEADAARQAYELMPRANFSRHVLEVCADALAVSRLPRIVWSDLGSPHRVMEALTRMRVRPEWARTLAPSA
ncbi:MAG TPA: sugar phosphate nucleotidyltransferase [Candidatus Deferrimicrobiaceae bacterium]|nr:sugar phosphate nucleotidyltransferase [Candidatus Deferrimicrobiaceae bacterium]